MPRRSLTEQGNTWFTYRGQEIEFYNKNINGLKDLKELLEIDNDDVEKDKSRKGDLNLTSVDAIRIAYDLIGRGVLKENHLEFIKKQTKISKIVKPILNPNQYFHLLAWLKDNKQISEEELKKASTILKEEPYEGI